MGSEKADPFLGQLGASLMAALALEVASA